MGFLDDARKWAKDRWKKSAEAVEEFAEAVGDTVETVGGYAIDGVKWLGNATIDKVQENFTTTRGWVKNTSGKFYGGVETALDNTSDGIRDAIGENVFSELLDSASDATRWVDDIQQGIYDNIDDVMEIVDDGIDDLQTVRNNLLDGTKTIFSGTHEFTSEYQEYNSELFKNLKVLFKDENGQESLESIRAGLEKVAKLAMVHGKTLEVNLTNGENLIFIPNDIGCEVYSANDLTDNLGTANKNGVFSKETLNKIAGKFGGRNDFEENALAKANENRQMNDFSKMLQNNMRSDANER